MATLLVRNVNNAKDENKNISVRRIQASMAQGLCSNVDPAALVKSVHADLRRRCQERRRNREARDCGRLSNQVSDDDIDKVWQEHVQDSVKLKEYAKAMRTLATTKWIKDEEEADRISWLSTTIERYFFDDDVHSLKKDSDRIIRKVCRRAGKSESVHLPNVDRVRVLDVGSCFDPFGTRPQFETLAVDLCPGSETVKKCDFLQVVIGESLRLTEDGREVLTLPGGRFFSMFRDLVLNFELYISILFQTITTL